MNIEQFVFCIILLCISLIPLKRTANIFLPIRCVIVAPFYLARTLLGIIILSIFIEMIRNGLWWLFFG